MKENGSVFRNDPLKERELWENLPQIIELAPGDQDELAAGGQQLFQSTQSAGGDATHVGQRLIEIASESEIVHTIWMTARLMGLYFKGQQTKGARLSGGAECPKSPKAQKKHG
jgi:hypothetical protein